MDDIIKNTDNKKTPESNINPILNYKHNPKQDNNDLDNLLGSIENMSKNDRNTMLNEIIDKGIENLNDSDKKILEKISNLQ